MTDSKLSKLVWDSMPSPSNELYADEGITPTWIVYNKQTGYLLAASLNKAEAKRIAACMNICLNVSTPALEDGQFILQKRLDQTH